MNRDKRTIVGVLPEASGGPAPKGDLPEVKSVRTLKVGDFTLKAEVLADGQRVIEKASFDMFLNWVAGGGAVSAFDAARVEEFIKGFSI